MNKPSKEQLKAHRLTEIAKIDQAPDEPIPLERQGTWPATRYLLEQPAADAMIAAIASGKPLLVRGEPGVGKSQLARAAAAILDRPFIFEVVQPDSEYTDLLWRIDHTKRLADAQMAGRRPVASDGEKESPLLRNVDNIAHYIGPGPTGGPSMPTAPGNNMRKAHPTFSPIPPSSRNGVQRGASFCSSTRSTRPTSASPMGCWRCWVMAVSASPLWADRSPPSARHPWWCSPATTPANCLRPCCVAASSSPSPWIRRSRSTLCVSGERFSLVWTMSCWPMPPIRSSRIGSVARICPEPVWPNTSICCGPSTTWLKTVQRANDG